MAENKGVTFKIFWFTFSAIKMCQKNQELKVKTKFYRENSFDAANFKYI